MTAHGNGPRGADLDERVRLLKMLRRVGWVEGATLLFLVGIAVPLKHFDGLPGLVSVAGPVHGGVFLLYLWLAVRVAAAEGWSLREVGRMLGVALVPFGTFFNDAFVKRKLIPLS